MEHATRRTIALGVGFLLAGLAYLYHLDSLHIPNIGDESRYLQIARATAASGELLPLRVESGLDATKPPLLFWQGIAATDRGREWKLWRLRLPLVAYTWLTALLVGLLTIRAGGARWDAGLAALIYLGCFSTFQHGRPFLTNAPETFYLFLPLVFLVGREFTWRVVLLSGLSLGIGALYKSFFLVVPVATGFGLILWRRRGWRLGEFCRHDLAKVVAMAGCGIAIFSLWFAVEPEPGAVFRQFVLGENLGKLGRGSFLAGLVSGTYPVWRIWFGDFLNVGLFTFCLAGLVWQASRRTRPTEADGGLTAPEREIWLYVLAFLVVYTIPSQRQENYILPTVAALSVLLALSWARLPLVLHRAGLLVAALAEGMLLWMMVRMPHALPGATYPAWMLVACLLLLGLTLTALLAPRLTREFFPAAVCGGLLFLAFALSPFDRGFEPAARGPGLEPLAGRTIWFPSNYKFRYERFRFLVPGSGIEGYPGRIPGRGLEVYEEGKVTALAVAVGDAPPAGATVYGEMYDLRTRLPSSDVAAIILRGEVERLVYRLVIVEKGLEQEAPPGPEGPGGA